MIACAMHHTLMLSGNGDVYAMGRHEYGKLGLGRERLTDKRVPTRIPSLKNCVHVSAGTGVSFAIDDRGSVFSWGEHGRQLGRVDDDDVYAPKFVKTDGRRGLAVSVGGQHVLLLVSEDERSLTPLSAERAVEEQSFAASEPSNVASIISSSVSRRSVAQQLNDEIEDYIDEDEVIYKSVSIASRTSVPIEEAVSSVLEDDEIKSAESVIDKAESDGRVSAREASDIRSRLSDLSVSEEEQIYAVTAPKESEEEEAIAAFEEAEPIKIVHRVVPATRLRDIEQMLEEIKTPTTQISDIARVQKKVFECLGLIN
jgi:hypothetical protein